MSRRGKALGAVQVEPSCSWSTAKKLLAGLLLVMYACGGSVSSGRSGAEDGQVPALPRPSVTSPLPSERSPVEGSPAAEAFSQVGGYVFGRATPRLVRELESQFSAGFEAVRPVQLEVRNVLTKGGQPLPVRALAVRYTLPPDVPFAAFVSEFGTDFLGATRDNSDPMFSGRGIYLSDPRDPNSSEAVAFFLNRDSFVYVFGAVTGAPTEEVARAIFNARS